MPAAGAGQRFRLLVQVCFAFFLLLIASAAEGRLTSRCYRYPNAAPERCYTAESDAVGNPTRLTDPEGTEVIEYDGLDRLGRVTRTTGGQGNQLETYTHNALGAPQTNAAVTLTTSAPAALGVEVATSRIEQ